MKIASGRSSVKNTFRDDRGFTLIELIMVGLVISLIVGGLWAVYWSIVNTYYQEQKGTVIQAEGEWIIDLMNNGGYCKGRRIYGLNSCYPKLDYPKVGSTNDFGGDPSDYRILFRLDEEDDNERYAEFYVDFNGQNPSSKLYFTLRTPDNPGNGNENYTVLITENLLQRKTGTDPDEYGNYTRTWLKAERLPFEGAGETYYCSGIKISFYLVDTTQPLLYNYRLDRDLETPIGDAAQRSSFLGGIPYPEYFSTTVYFPNREQ